MYMVSNPASPGNPTWVKLWVNPVP
jgi:hypothetical protein